MSDSRIPRKHGEGPSRGLDHGPEGLIPGTERRRQAPMPRKGRPRKSTNRGNKKPSNAGPRYRAKDVLGTTVELGRESLVDSNGVSYSTTVTQHLLHSSIKRCWDESHKLTRPVIGWYEKYYKIPGTGYKGAKPLIGVKNQRIFGKPVHNDGGPLRLIECQVNPVTNDEIQGIGTYYGSDYRPYGFAERYVGGFVPANWNHGFSRVDFNEAGFSGSLGPDFEPALPYGAEVYNKMRPRITDFDAMQGIGQNLYELPSQLATTSKGLSQAYRSMRGSGSAARELFMPENIAGQFLNEQFGWAPFVGDLLSLHRAYSRQTKRFKEISSQNNRWNRRKRTLFNIEEQSPITTIDDFAGNCYPPLLSGFYRNSGTFVTSKLWTSVRRKVWGVGAFKFYAPEFDSQNRTSEGKYGEIMRAVHYYGVQVSPSAVWELMPWSWLVDWFTNAGNVIDNITAQVFDRLVSKYAYVMCLSHHWAFNQTTIHLKGGDILCNWAQKITSKRREEASPYGFGLTNGDLSARQQLILAAVGITRK